MASQKKKIYVVIVFFLFIVYFFVAARPIPKETILAVRWISSLDTQTPFYVDSSPLSGSRTDQFLPFVLGSHFGYVDTAGQFAVNKIKTTDIYLGENMWAEYGAEPSGIEIKNLSGETAINIENTGGYPVLLDNRVFILGSEMNSLSEIDANGNVLWTYEFGSILTCIDAAAGIVVTGSLDGIVEILDSKGSRIHYFEPGGSRLSVILGCAVSKNGSQVGIISGIDKQRFLLLERFGAGGGEYRVVYHEFLETGFRRAVHISFIDEDRCVVFERTGGISCYNIRSRRGVFIPLNGEIAAIDNSGDQGLLFLIISHSRQNLQLMQRNELVGIKIPQYKRFMFINFINIQDMIFLRASFKSDDIFLGRAGSMLIAGGGSSLISFELEEK